MMLTFRNICTEYYFICCMQKLLWGYCKCHVYLVCPVHFIAVFCLYRSKQNDDDDGDDDDGDDDGGDDEITFVSRCSIGNCT